MIMILVYLKRIYRCKKILIKQNSNLVGGTCCNLKQTIKNLINTTTKKQTSKTTPTKNQTTQTKTTKNQTQILNTKKQMGGKLSEEDERIYLTCLRHPELLSMEKINTIMYILKTECTPEEMDEFIAKLTDDEMEALLDRMRELYEKETGKKIDSYARLSYLSQEDENDFTYLIKNPELLTKTVLSNMLNVMHRDCTDEDIMEFLNKFTPEEREIFIQKLHEFFD